MRVTGLIAEYNPFHNGHLYHIQKAKEITGADHVLVVMSGNFVQRGAPAVMPKHMRAKAALEAGASAVIELPACFSCGSAEYFAGGAVALLERLRCIDAVCFGSECGDAGILRQIASTAAGEPEPYKTLLKEALRAGYSFPRARQMAMESCTEADGLPGALSQPNNILGAEYIKALLRENSSMEIHTVKRMGSDYHGESLGEHFSSASAIRKALSSHPGQLPEVLEGQVPPFCVPLLKDTYGKRYPVFTDDFSLLLKYRLMAETADSMAQYMDVTRDIANRILKHREDFLSFSQFCSLIKTKNLTYARVSRCLLHILLNIKKGDVLSSKEEGFCPYARILGFRKDSTSLLSRLKKHSGIPLVTRPTHAGRLSGAGLHMLSQDIFASDLYESVLTDKFQVPFVSEYRRPVITI